MSQSQRQALCQAKRIIVKLGTSSLLHTEGRPQGEVLLPLARQIATLREQGREIILVSSGAVGMGRKTPYGRKIEPKHMAAKQALAAKADGRLTDVYLPLTDGRGPGTTVHFTTRLGRQEGAKHEAAATRPVKLQGVRVLVVDDNATNRWVLKERLRNWHAHYTAGTLARSSLPCGTCGTFGRTPVHVYRAVSGLSGTQCFPKLKNHCMTNKGAASFPWEF